MAAATYCQAFITYGADWRVRGMGASDLQSEPLSSQLAASFDLHEEIVARIAHRGKAYSIWSSCRDVRGRKHVGEQREIERSQGLFCRPLHVCRHGASQRHEEINHLCGMGCEGSIDKQEARYE